MPRLNSANPQSAGQERPLWTLSAKPGYSDRAKRVALERFADSSGELSTYSHVSDRAGRFKFGKTKRFLRNHLKFPEF